MQYANYLVVSVGPARAGMIRFYARYDDIAEGWPRTSGDDPDARNGIVGLTTLAPHERG